MESIIAPFAGAFAVSFVLTLLAERVARRAGLVARPVADRWHRAPVPLMGGLPVVVVTLGLTLATAGVELRFLVLVVAAFVMALVGFVDDVRSLDVQWKLLAQILLAVGLLEFGFLLHLTGYHLVDVLITLVWVVGITNAFNLLDNMDGLSASIALVTGGFRLLFFHWDGDQTGVQISAIFLGAVAGFLVRNFPPAKIFMGDTGSLFLGFFLAALSLADTRWPYSRGLAAVLVIPVLLLMIPIFDTAFVTLTRIFSGRPLAVGGRDHTSHRLVAIGLREWQVVVLLAGLAIASGGIAVLSYRDLSGALVLGALLAIALVLLGIYLGRVRVVHTAEEYTGGAVVRLLADFQYKRQVLTVALDICLIVIAYYAAYLLRFEQAFDLYRDQLDGSLPVVLIIQLATLAGFGLYRGIWQYTGVSDVLRIVRATTVGAMATLVALVYMTRFSGFSRTVFILDWLLLIVLIAGSRASFRFFGTMFRPRPDSYQRVLVYGAGDGGELIVREMLNNPALQRTPVGFIDDDPGKHETRIHGLPVFGGGGEIEALVRERRITELIVSSAKITGNGLERVSEVCRRLNIPIRRASFRLE